jgi:anti-sigma B factor antagonist
LDTEQDLTPGREHCVVGEQWMGRQVVVSVSGTLDLLTAPQLTDSIETSLRKQPTVLIVDLSDVEFLASAGMSVLIEAHHAAAPDTRFAVVADGPATSRPMKIIGLTDMVDLYPTLDEALSGFTD